MLKQFWMDDNGAIVSIEMVLIITIAVLALIVGWSEVAVAINSELDDISNAVGKFDQSYGYVGYGSLKNDGSYKAYYRGAQFIDAPDDCDSCSGTSTIVCNVPAVVGPGLGG